MMVLHGGTDWSVEAMNDPANNQLEGGLAKTGAFSECVNDFGVYDMVGNLHEWTADPEGTFRGGYYLDTKINGEGCNYRTIAHVLTALGTEVSRIELSRVPLDGVAAGTRYGGWRGYTLGALASAHGGGPAFAYGLRRPMSAVGI